MTRKLRLPRELETLSSASQVAQVAGTGREYYEEGANTPEAGLIKYLDDSAQTHFLWTFFAPEGEGRRK